MRLTAMRRRTGRARRAPITGSVVGAIALLASVGTTTALADPAPVALAELPLIEVAVPEATPSAALDDVLVVWYSGGGGWAALDAGVARRLAAAGVPVVGVSSLRYFWTELTPATIAADFTRIAEHYARTWQRPRVALVGHAFGANVAPFIAARLDAAGSDAPVLLGLVSPARHASFEFHVDDWLRAGASGVPVAPEIARLGTLPIVCAYGIAGSETSLCTSAAIEPSAAEPFVGGDRLNDDHDGIAAVLLGALERAAKRHGPAEVARASD